MTLTLGWLALVSLQSLPAYLFVAGSGIGRDWLERLAIAVVLSGPTAALFHVLQLTLGISPGVAWVVLIAFDVVAVLAWWRLAGWSPSPAARAVARADASPVPWRLLALIVVVSGIYFQTSAVFSRPLPSGELALARSLQRDMLFHVGMVRGIEQSYPASLLSFGGKSVGYHVGYHLQLASWCRLLGMDALDAVLRFGAGLQIVLLMLTAFAFGHRLHPRPGARAAVALWSAGLVIASGLGFVFFYRESVDWWSLVFMDAGLVSIFLVNPLLPAMSLLLTGLICSHDELLEAGESRGHQTNQIGRRAGSWARLLVIAVCGGWVLLVKMFVGAQWLAAVMMALVVRRPSRALLRVAVALSVAAVPASMHTLFAASASNTAVSLRPFEIVRYSMEKLDWAYAIGRLSEVGRFSADPLAWLVAVAVGVFWLAGFLGIRVFALPMVVSRLFGADPLWRILSWFALMGFPLTLLFRIAPAEAVGESRLEAQNDAIWFATQSGLLWWFFLAAVIVDFVARQSPRRRVIVTILVVAASFAGTGQHFVYQRSHGVDVVGADRLLAADTARSLSAVDDVWLESPDRAHPSLLAYWSGRPVVYDPYVGYDYMFASRAETERRRHAISQFWRGRDPGLQTWLLKDLEVDWIWSHDDSALAGIRNRLILEFSDSISLWRVDTTGVRSSDAGQIRSPIRLPPQVPMNRSGAMYLGGFSAPRGRPPHRTLAPGATGILYIPHPAGRVDVSLDAASEGDPGRLQLVGSGTAGGEIQASRREVALGSLDFSEEGFAEIAVLWQGSRSLRIHSFSFAPHPP